MRTHNAKIKIKLMAVSTDIESKYLAYRLHQTFDQMRIANAYETAKQSANMVAKLLSAELMKKGH
jgi:hypothetical protein